MTDTVQAQLRNNQNNKDDRLAFDTFRRLLNFFKPSSHLRQAMASKRSHPTVENGLLPPAYRFTSDRTTALAHFETIDWALHNLPGVYWGKERSSEKLRRQVENGRAVMVLKQKAFSEKSDREWIPREGEASFEKEDLIGYMRIVTDEEE